MKRRLKQIIIGGVMGVVLMGMASGLRASAVEIIDEKGDRWIDITEAIGEWPLNTFNAMYISEYDFEENSLSVIFNGLKTDSDTGEKMSWRANEVMLAWQNYDGIFKRNEFTGLKAGEMTDRYIPLVYYDFDAPLDSGTELKIGAERLEGELMEYFYSKRLAFVMRNAEGDATRADFNAAFACAAELLEGQVCRLYYKEPLSGGGASSGLTRYFPVQKRDVDAGTGVDDAMVAELESKNDSGDIKEGVNDEFVVEDNKRYSSGDIFDDNATDVTSSNDSSGVVIPDEFKYIRYETRRLVNNNIENNERFNGEVRDTSDAVSLIAATAGSSDNDIQENREEEIEVPRLGAVERRIDYKWLFLPVLGLILMIYWWFLVPIFKKRQKSEKKSKKSVDNT